MRVFLSPKLRLSLSLLAAFCLWTALLCCLDVRPAGPEGSSVGLAGVNLWFHGLTGVHMGLYDLTDRLGLIPLATAAGFGMLGLSQWIRRKHLKFVDRSLVLLGIFYAAVIGMFILFELFPVNFRPVLIAGAMEASYPSSTTLLCLCVMPTAAMQLRQRITRPGLRTAAVLLVWLFTAFMVICRLISGVHWLSDIIGGILLSAGLVTLYDALNHPVKKA